MSNNDYINLARKVRDAIEKKMPFNMPLLKMAEFSKLLNYLKSV